MTTKRWSINVERTVTYSDRWVVEAPEAMTAEEVRQHVSDVLDDTTRDQLGDGDPQDFTGTPAIAAADDKVTHHLHEDGTPFTPPPPVWVEPTESEWFDIDGHRWATNGYIAFREDGPRPHPDYRPNTYGEPRSWQATIADLDVFRAYLSSIDGVLKPHGSGPTYDGIGVFLLADADGKPVFGVQGWFRPLLDAPDLLIVRSSAKPFVVLALRDGQPVAFVAALREDTWRTP